MCKIYNSGAPEPHAQRTSLRVQLVQSRLKTPRRKPSEVAMETPNFIASGQIARSQRWSELALRSRALVPSSFLVYRTSFTDLQSTYARQATTFVGGCTANQATAIPKQNSYAQVASSASLWTVLCCLVESQPKSSFPQQEVCRAIVPPICYISCKSSHKQKNMYRISTGFM